MVRREVHGGGKRLAWHKYTAGAEAGALEAGAEAGAARGWRDARLERGTRLPWHEAGAAQGCRVAHGWRGKVVAR